MRKVLALVYLGNCLSFGLNFGIFFWSWGIEWQHLPIAIGNLGVSFMLSRILDRKGVER